MLDVNHGLMDSSNLAVDAALTGLTSDELRFAGSDELNVFLKGKALKDLLQQLAESGQT